MLLQLRLLQFGVQAVGPHKDTGNDLLAVRDAVFKAIQVKTSRAPKKGTQVRFRRKKLMATEFHILALVRLQGKDSDLKLDNCRIYLLMKDEVGKGCFELDELEPYRLSAERIDSLFV